MYTTMTERLRKAFAPETFRQQGHQLIDLLADHLEACLQAIPNQVIPWQAPQEAFEQWKRDYQTSDQSDPLSFFQQLIEQSIYLHHPRYLGHQIAPPVPVAALSGLLSDLLNNGMGVYEMGIGATAIERLVVKEVSHHLGFDQQAGGFLTSGGTLANLTALLAARSLKASAAIWEKGSQKQLAILVSEEAHYCVDRAVRIMGWGTEGIVKVAVDGQFRMRTDLLESTLVKAQKENKEVIAVVGSACSTSTGTYDQLDAIADFCERHQLWFHVDGAHGAAAIFSSKYQHLLQGIHRADSVVMDFHKMMMTPALATGLFFRREQDSYQTFSQKAQYLWEQTQKQEWHNLAKRTFECTKYMMSIKVYSIFRTHGPALFDDFVTTLYDLGQTFAGLIEDHPHFELAVLPQTNILCFRWNPT
ncbi:MAG: aminotransferase class I/II-fold pyridoxal phosphate-dependent enzyme, partial [Bacteroidota bacterium]